MRIEISQLPPVEYSQNSRAHWRQKYEAGRVYKEAVFYSCVNTRTRALMQGDKFPIIRAKINLTFIFPKKRRRDRDNCLSMFKPGLDSIVDAGLLLDDDAEHLQIGEVNVVVDPKRAPLTIIELEEL